MRGPTPLILGVENVFLVWYGLDMLNKSDFIKMMLAESGAVSEEEPAGLFMAGLPGSGKTEISKNLIKDSGVELLRIDMDEIAEMLPDYEPSRADEFRKPATALLSELFKYALHHKISFLMDGTFGSSQADKNIKRSLKHGFRVQIIYALQDPKIAWEFTVAREKIEHRAIKFEGFVEAYYKTINNINEISKKYGDLISLDIAIKTPKNEVGGWVRGVSGSDIDEFVKAKYNKDELIEYILGA